MSTSVEKIAELRDSSSGAFDPEREPSDAEVMIRSGLKFAGPLLDQFLPDDPAELDDFLAVCAAEILALRSDDAPAPQLDAGQVDGEADEIAGELAP